MPANVRMNPDVKTEWIRALRGNNYVQGTGALRYVESLRERWCCLGLLCDLAVKAGVIDDPVFEDAGSIYRYGEGNRSSYPPNEVMEWAGIETVEAYYYTSGELNLVSLVGLNDHGFTFSEIADTIEQEF